MKVECKGGIFFWRADIMWKCVDGFGIVVGWGDGLEGEGMKRERS